MVRADDLRKDQVQFAVATLANTPLHLHRGEPVSIGDNRVTPQVLSLSGSRVLLALLSATASFSLFLWAVIKLWLFGQ
jgi:hypothetical protein